MTKLEFTEELRRALSGRVDYATVNEHVAYYESYLDAEIRKGRSEREVLEELGDPRLIAKTILEAGKVKSANRDARTEKRGGAEKRYFVGAAHVTALLLFVVLLCIAALLLKLAGVVLALLLPLAIPALLVWLLIRWIRKR